MTPTPTQPRNFWYESISRPLRMGQGIAPIHHSWSSASSNHSLPGVNNLGKHAATVFQLCVLAARLTTPISTNCARSALLGASGPEIRSR